MDPQTAPVLISHQFGNFEPKEEKVINPMLFEKAQTEIFLLMNRDPFLRFQRTLKENSRIN